MPISEAEIWAAVGLSAADRAKLNALRPDVRAEVTRRLAAEMPQPPPPPQPAVAIPRHAVAPFTQTAPWYGRSKAQAAVPRNLCARGVSAMCH